MLNMQQGTNQAKIELQLFVMKKKKKKVQVLFQINFSLLKPQLIYSFCLQRQHQGCSARTREQLELDSLSTSSWGA